MGGCTEVLGGAQARGAPVRERTIGLATETVRLDGLRCRFGEDDSSGVGVGSPTTMLGEPWLSDGAGVGEPASALELDSAASSSAAKLRRRGETRMRRGA